MLPFLGALLFALIGIGALVVDGGLALSEQARLETAAEMMVREWAFVAELPNDALPADCVVGGNRREGCLERAYLAPMLSPLGVELSEGAGGDVDVERFDASLGGSAIDPRGARLGGLVLQGAFDAGTPDSVRLRRSTPLLFGWAALPARTSGAPDQDFGAVQAARAAEGLSPDLDGPGLRGNGFSLRARAAIAPRGTPAIRVGPSIRNAEGVVVTGGLVGVAWLASDLIGREGSGQVPLLVEAMLAADAADPAASFEAFGRELRAATGEAVACLFDAGSVGAHVGQEIGDPAGPLRYVGSIPPERWPSAYVPVISPFIGSEACNTPAPILGFLEVAIDAQADPSAIRVRPSAGLRRNATDVPSSGAGGAADVWFSDRRLQLVATSAWDVDRLDLALRIPIAESRVYDDRVASEAALE